MVKWEEEEPIVVFDDTQKPSWVTQPILDKIVRDPKPKKEKKPKTDELQAARDEIIYLKSRAVDYAAEIELLESHNYGLMHPDSPIYGETSPTFTAVEKQCLTKILKSFTKSLLRKSPEWVEIARILFDEKFGISLNDI